MKEIAPGVFVETSYSLITVGAILTSAGWVCIDTPPYPRDARAWKVALQALSPKPIRYVISTDHHRDRILGNIWFDAPVVAHEATAEVVAGLKSVFTIQSAEELGTNDAEMAEIANVKLIPPQISYTHTLTLHCGNRAITVSHHPSATAGSSWVTLSDERTIFVGDLIVTNQHPYAIDGLSKPWLDGLRILRLERYSDWKIIPGRREIASMAETQPLSDYLRVARRRVSSLVRADRPRSETAGLIPEFLTFFPFESERRDEIQRRIKILLELIYEEIRAGQEEDADTE
jgi:glyoxylase-like metal-dependent hydrolase (beta-lactamase superfamily II)